MSTITVFGAAGQFGSRLVAEAASRGHRVRAVVRSPRELDLPEGAELVVGDATDAASVRELAADSDVLVVAVGGPGRDIWRRAAQTLLETVAALPEPRPRIIHLGGGASLTTPDGTRFLDLPDFPAEYLDPAVGQAEALDAYLASSDVDWTFVSPPPVEFFPGERRGVYRVGGDQPVVDADGRSALSYEDLAVVVVDEIESPRHRRERVTAAY